MLSLLLQVNWEHVHEHKLSKDCTIPMGVTSDEVAQRFSVSREVGGAARPSRVGELAQA